MVGPRRAPCRRGSTARTERQREPGSVARSASENGGALGVCAAHSCSAARCSLPKRGGSRISSGFCEFPPGRRGLGAGWGGNSPPLGEALSSAGALFPCAISSAAQGCNSLCVDPPCEGSPEERGGQVRIPGIPGPRGPRSQGLQRSQASGATGAPGPRNPRDCRSQGTQAAGSPGMSPPRNPRGPKPQVSQGSQGSQIPGSSGPEVQVRGIPVPRSPRCPKPQGPQGSHATGTPGVPGIPGPRLPGGRDRRTGARAPGAPRGSRLQWSGGSVTLAFASLAEEPGASLSASFCSQRGV